MNMQLEYILSPISAAAAAIAVLFSIVYYFIKNRNILPGPTGLPYLGLFPVLKDETCHIDIEKMGEKYGDLFSFTYLGNLMINLGSVKAIREVHVNKVDSFTGRFTGFSILTYIFKDGAAMSNGEVWRVLRKYFIQVFKEYGFTSMRDNTTGPIYDSLSTAIENIKVHNGAAFDVMALLNEKCTETIQKVFFGERSSREEIYAMAQCFMMSMEGITGAKILYIGPLAKLLYYTSPKLRATLAQQKLLENILYNSVKKIESTMDENNPTCIVEHYFADRNRRKRSGDAIWKYLTDKALVASLAQFIGDGILSVAFFIGLLLNALIEHPKEQDKIYKEIMDVVGPGRMPTIEDKSKLTYTNAFMNETIRTSAFFPIFPSLECTQETTIRGYRIPKGSITLLNIWAAHHDPQTYENPYTFDPSRFIPAPGKPRPELPVQFGIGKRACTGEAYVMMQSFLFITNFVKAFNISEPEKPKTKPELFLITGNLELCMQPRSET